MRDNRNCGEVLRDGKGGEASTLGRKAGGCRGSLYGCSTEGKPSQGWLGALTIPGID